MSSVPPQKPFKESWQKHKVPEPTCLCQRNGDAFFDYAGRSLVLTDTRQKVRFMLQDLRSNGLRFHSIDPGQLVARVYGSTGLVTGESWTVTSRNGVESRAHFRFIAVYSLVRNSFRLVHFQSTNLARSD